MLYITYDMIGTTYFVLKITESMRQSIFEYFNEENNRKKYLNYGRSFYEALTPCILESIYQNINDNAIILPHNKTDNIYNLTFCFRSITNDEIHKIEYLEIEKRVFKTVDDYLVFLVKADMKWEKRNTNTRLKFDDFLKEKIKESQEKKPYKWIF